VHYRDPIATRRSSFVCLCVDACACTNGGPQAAIGATAPSAGPQASSKAPLLPQVHAGAADSKTGQPQAAWVKGSGSQAGPGNPLKYYYLG
jgi:hypothetical protein